jgi:hypothetical protein
MVAMRCPKQEKWSHFWQLNKSPHLCHCAGKVGVVVSWLGSSGLLAEAETLKIRSAYRGRLTFSPLDKRCLEAYIYACMRRLSFFISEPLNDGLKALKERDGVAEAESIRRALDAYLKEKGVLVEKNAKGKGKKK